MRISFNNPALVAGAALFAAATLGAQTDWPTYGHDEYSTHHSPLKQVDTKNVSKLERSWTYHMLDPSTPVGVAPAPPVVPGAPAGGRGRGRGGAAAAAADQGDDAPAAAAGRGGRGATGGSGGRGGGAAGSGQGARSEATPIVAGGVMYLPIPQRRVIAIIPETGKELWSYDLGNTNAATRGVEYWPGDTQSPATVFFGTTDGRLVGLNAKTGKPVPGFGVEGFVDIKAGYKGSFSLSSPPKIYKNVVITGARVQESPAIGSPGDTRGWDAHTGKLLWTFHSVPRPGEAGHDTWQGDDWVDRSGVNVWGLISVDSQLGLVYLPHGSPSADFYGGDRLGDNLYGNSLVAVDAMTGQVKWYFQSIHHDTWDFDMQSAPILFDVKRGATKIPALAITSKTGLVFILDRRTGKSIYGVEERPVPPPPLPGDGGGLTQPWPVKPAPLGRQEFKYPDDIAKVTPEHEAFCRNLVENGPPQAPGAMKGGGPFTRYGLENTIQFPGTLGATNWHGGSYNPDLGYLFYNVLYLADVGKMNKNPNATPENKQPVYTLARSGRFWDGQKYWPCQAPPWGQMVAINVNTGDYVWRVPLGVIPELEAKGVKDTGTMNMGGSLSTSGGLVFISATTDHRFRAFDAKTGKILWETQLEAGAYDAPITYQGKDGKQYVAIVATGGGYYDRTLGDSLIAFRLP